MDATIIILNRCQQREEGVGEGHQRLHLEHEYCDRDALDGCVIHTKLRKV